MAAIRKLLVVGCGNMGAALAGGFSLAHPAARVVALDSDPQRAAALLPGGAAVDIHHRPDELAAFRPDVVIFALKPQVLGAALADFVALCGEALVISVAAGLGLERFAALLGGHRRVVRAMPNLPVVARQGMTTLHGAVGADDAAACEAVFAAVGKTLWVEHEAQIDAATAVAGSGPAYFLAVVEQLARAGEAEGLPAELARQLATQTCIGTAHLLQQDGRDAAALKAAVCSPRGTTEAGLAAMETPDGLPRVIAAGVRAAHRRARELATA